MSYKLTTYSPSFLEKQFEIGNNRLGKWLGARQTPVERLQKIYSQPDFDPKTKFYALFDGEVVGFLTSKIKDVNAAIVEANLEFPIVAEGHEPIEEQLIDFAFASLRNMGVHKVRTRISEPWGNSVSLAKKYGYEQVELLWKNAVLEVNKYKSADSNVDAEEVTESDFDEIRDIMIAFRKNTSKEAQAQIDKLVSIRERVTSWKIIRENNKIVGHDHLVEDIMDSKRARMNAIYATSDDIRDRIMNSHVNAAIKNGIKHIDNFFFGPTLDMEGPYIEYGFEVAELWAFEKTL